MQDSTAIVGAKFSIKTGLKALIDPKMAAFMVLCISYGVATKSTGTFLPQIIGRLVCHEYLRSSEGKYANL